MEVHKEIEALRAALIERHAAGNSDYALANKIGVSASIIGLFRRGLRKNLSATIYLKIKAEVLP